MRSPETSDETRRLFTPPDGAFGLADRHRDLQARRGVSLHDRQRRSRGAVCPRRRLDEAGSRGARAGEGDALPRTDAAFPASVTGRYLASGSGRIWNFTSLASSPLPPIGPEPPSMCHDVYDM